MTIRTAALPILALVAVVVGACSGAASPSPTAAPSPTPITVRVASPEDAAAMVMALDPRFKGAVPFSPDLIGGSKTWTAEARPDGGFRVSLTVGWGDCPTGCINQHKWVYDVLPDGSTSLVEESGDDVPMDLPA
jgi:hypothetical protein